MGEQSRGVQVVCFDLGGVIVRICRSWEEACKRAGVEVRASQDRKDAEHLLRIRADAVRAYQSGELECQMYFETIARSTGALYNAREVSAIHKAWTCEDYRGVETLVKALRETTGITTACLSNTNLSHWRILSRGDGPKQPASATVRRIERPLVSHELGVVKPDDAIYERAQSVLAVQADEIVFFDDTRVNVLAALRHGWRAFEIDYRGDTAAQMRRLLKDLGILGE